MSAIFASANSATSTQPQLVVEYRDMKGVESYWSGSSHSAGLAGSGYVNHANGNMVFSIGTIGTSDSLFNYVPSLIYNSSLADKFYLKDSVNVPYSECSTGYGWKISACESIVKPHGQNYYVWADGDGTEHYFLPDTSTTASNDYKDEDGLLLTLTVQANAYYVEVFYEKGNFEWHDGFIRHPAFLIL
jgi:hypothetical protein